MLWAIFSDVHSNVDNLIKFLSKVRGVDEKACLGDLIHETAGFHGQETIKLTKEHNCRITRGNHEDAYLVREEDAVLRNLYPDNTLFLQKAPTILVYEPLLFTHSRISKNLSKDKRILSIEEAVEEFNALLTEYPEIKFLFSGHSHIPLVFEYAYGGVRRLDHNQRLFLNNKGPYIISPGSLSMVDLGQKCTYAIFDDKKFSLEIKTI